MSLSKAIRAIEELASDLVHLPGSQEYNDLLQSYFSELERDIKPACFITPNSASQVADVVKAAGPLIEPSMLAICGAGQQSTPGVANVNDGITIHLSRLRGITVDLEKQRVSIGAGERMGAVYEKLAATGHAVVGNRHSSGGIGGDAVQGGLSYFSYAQGFVCDNVVNYEIVLASGEIVNANSETRADLWVALKGGANNFGIVTRFDLRIFPQGQLWGGKIFYFQESFSEQLRHLVKYLNDPTPDTDIHICLSLGYAAAMGSMLAMNDIFCTRPEKPVALQPFADIVPQLDQMRSVRLDSLKGLTDEGFPGAVGNRVVKMSTTVKADAEMLDYTVETFMTAFAKLKDVGNLIFSISFEAIPVSLIKQSIARGGNSLGLQPSDGPLVVVLLYTSWDKVDDDAKVYEANHEALRTIEDKAKADGKFSPYVYMNYAFKHQDPIASYGLDVRSNLQAVSARYDPDGLFQNAGVGPWKLEKVLMA
ncbi:hypothetical protein GGR57DRAFT_519853 [Xylariaceae sp. FL1272]|nr:hypothetical protein GGR57DRAFT_519853 [Xylariaceae sp. FL1272]